MDEFTLLRVDGSRVEFRVRSSAGTYIRSLAHDLGTAIGVPAHLASLRRTAIGSFDIGRAISTAAIRGLAAAEVFAAPHFTPMNEMNLPLESVLVDPMQQAKLMQGQPVVVRPQSAALQLRDLASVMTASGELVAIAEVTEVLREGGGPVVLQPKVVLK